MPLALRIRGTSYPSMPLLRAMHVLAREALRAGIGPLALRLHEGRSAAGTRWLGGVGYPTHPAAIQAVNARGENAIRWFGAPDEVLEFGAQFWVLSNQWSWDHPAGSCREDLERLRDQFPQLELSWDYTS